jgi:hypothetical protein
MMRSSGLSVLMRHQCSSGNVPAGTLGIITLTLTLGWAFHSADAISAP